MNAYFYLRAAPVWLVTLTSLEAQIPVTDVSVLAQTLENVRLATEQLRLLQTQLSRWGDPAGIQPSGAIAAQDSLTTPGLGKSLDEIQALADGAADLFYDGAGLYRAVGDTIFDADGQPHTRPLRDYRKFDAITQARQALELVLSDTEARREAVRHQIAAAMSQLEFATTVAEVQKLQAVVSAHSADLAAIDRERDAALARVLVQQIENQTDSDRQAQAHREERVVDFRKASAKLADLLRPDTRPVRIPERPLSEP